MLEFSAQASGLTVEEVSDYLKDSELRIAAPLETDGKDAACFTVPSLAVVTLS